MRVLILNALYPTPLYPKVVGGAEKSVRNLAEALVMEGHEVEVIRAGPSRSLVTREVLNGVVIFCTPSKNVYWPFDGVKRANWLRLLWHLIDDWGPTPNLVRERLDRFKPDVMHTNTLTGLTTGAWSLARRRGIRVVHTLRDYYLICPKSKYYKNGENCSRQCVDCKALTVRRRRNAEIPDAVVGNSHATLQLHLEAGLFSSVPVRTAIGSVRETGSFPLPRRARKEGSATVFGFIGRVTEEKGVELLAQAFGELPDGAAELVIAGESDPAIQVRLQGLARGRDIRFMGFVEPRDFYQEVDVVVAPSLWHEPLPRSVIDAISYGRPVIGSNRGGTPESMGDPPFGWIFNPADEGALMRAMANAISEIDRLAPAQLDSRPSPQEKYMDLYRG